MPPSNTAAVTAAIRTERAPPPGAPRWDAGAATLRCMELSVSSDRGFERRGWRPPQRLVHESTHYVTSDDDRPRPVDRSKLSRRAEHRRVERAPVGEVVVLGAGHGDRPYRARLRQCREAV